MDNIIKFGMDHDPELTRLGDEIMKLIENFESHRELTNVEVIGVLFIKMFQLAEGCMVEDDKCGW